MLEVNLCKYRQDTEMRDELLNSKYDGKTFVEASPTDCIWGIGLAEDDAKNVDPINWRGQNLLGKVITECRERLLKDLRIDKYPPIAYDVRRDNDGNIERYNFHWQDLETGEDLGKMTGEEEKEMQAFFKYLESKAKAKK